MEHKIINTGDYLLIVDDSEIKEGDWCIDIYKLKNNHNPIFKWSDKFKVDAKKIIAHLPFNNSPILEGVDLLPPLEDEVEKLADEISKKHGFPERVTISRESFKSGYNKSKEKYKYTEEDVLSAIEVGFDLGKNFDDDNPNIGLGWLIYQKDNFIKSIQQSKMPVGFKSETVIKMGSDMNGRECWDGVEPKTTTNSQGLTQWVGEYIY